MKGRTHSYKIQRKGEHVHSKPQKMGEHIYN